MNAHEQSHLSWDDTINLGSYYTPLKIVNNLYSLLQGNIKDIKNLTIMDTSCGYGAFLANSFCPNNKYIGADIDEQAIDTAKQMHPNINFFIQNSLSGASRKSYNLASNEPLVIVGNPPYNDTTSIIRNGIKEAKFEIDGDLIARDLGLSFLLSYNKLKADYVCVLHPLSYLIKKTNFNLLKDFKNNYKLIDSLVFSSAEFTDTSKSTQFPIIMALYKKDDIGMDYDFIQSYKFKTIEGKKFSIGDFDYVSNYITKYPNKKHFSSEDAFALFWTMRDINALKRSRTFIDSDGYNAIYVPKDKMSYYCYVDVFKKYISNMPYYFGNCDIIIDNEEFLKIEKFIKVASIKNNPILKNKYKSFLDSIDKKFDCKCETAVDEYFKKLLGEHYVYQH